MSSPATGPSAGLTPVVRFLVLAVAAIGFLFDTYELLMFPAMGASAISDLLPGRPPVDDASVRLWIGRILWIAALSGGVFGLLGGWLVDRLGRKFVMVASIFLYSFSPVAAAFSTELWHLVLFRCTTFIGVCVEMVAAVTWLAELFDDKRAREKAIGWTLAFASLGGLFVTLVYKWLVTHARDLPALPVPEGFDPHAAWRYTLLTGLVPGALILVLMPFVPESKVWAEKKRTKTLGRPSFGALFSPELRRTTIVTALLSACAYGAAFGALQLTPSVIAPGLPDIAAVRKEAPEKIKAAEAKVKAAAEGTDDRKQAEAELGKAKRMVGQAIETKRGDIQLWQELGGLTGRILFAVLLAFLPSGLLLRLFLVPGIVLFPLTYLVLVKGAYVGFAAAIFFCGLLTVAQMSYMSEYLPKVFPVHMRGTGAAFATNVGARMFGTMAAVLNTELLVQLFTSAPDNSTKVAQGAALIGGTVFLAGFVLSFLLPKPRASE